MGPHWVRSVQGLGNVHRRFLAALFAALGPRLSYRITGWGAGLIYQLLDPLRARSEAQCRAALGGRVDARDVPRIARQSFINRARNITDLMLASHLLRPGTFGRYGGALPEPFLTELREDQHRRQPTILLTAYYGSFDLLPIFLGYNGIQASAVYLPHSNKGFDEYRRRVRGQSGSEMVPVDQAVTRFNQVLGQGGTVAILADHHDESRGMPVKFLGLETKVSRSVGLLAWRHEANVVVAALRRVDDTFRFQLVVADVIYHTETAASADPVEFVIHRYMQAIERIILEDPTQYLWAYARWGNPPAQFSESADLSQTSDLNDCSTVAGGIGNGHAEPKG